MGRHRHEQAGAKDGQWTPKKHQRVTSPTSRLRGRRAASCSDCHRWETGTPEQFASPSPWRFRRPSPHCSDSGLRRSWSASAHLHRSIGAEEAFTRGLANKLGTLDDAQEWAHRIANLAPLSLRHMKMVLNDDGTMEEQSPEQLDALHAAWLSEDVQEARAARIENRPPVFKGK